MGSRADVRWQGDVLRVCQVNCGGLVVYLGNQVGQGPLCSCCCNIHGVMDLCHGPCSRCICTRLHNTSFVSTTHHLQAQLDGVLAIITCMLGAFSLALDRYSQLKYCQLEKPPQILQLQLHHWLPGIRRCAVKCNNA